MREVEEKNKVSRLNWFFRGLVMGMDGWMDRWMDGWMDGWMVWYGNLYGMVWMDWIGWIVCSLRLAVSRSLSLSISLCSRQGIDGDDKSREEQFLKVARGWKQ